MLNVKKEIELACKRENPNWDGKSFDYGCNIYQNAYECYEAIQPIIEKEGHSGFSYGMFVRILTKLLEGKVLTPITEDDFKDEFPKESGLSDDTREDGTTTRQCMRYTSLFRTTKPDGTISYDDVHRVITINQYGHAWSNGLAERYCKDLIPPITLPYMPSDNPIKIFVWEFSYDKATGLYKERGSYNSLYIDKIIFPNGEVKKVDRLYIGNGDRPDEFKESFFNELKAFIEEDIRKYKEGREVKTENE